MLNFLKQTGYRLPNYGSQAVCQSVQTAEGVLNRIRLHYAVLFQNQPEDSTEAQDLEYVEQSKQGQPDAFRHLIEKYQNVISRMMWKFSRDSQVHEELVQEVFVRAWYSLQTFQAKGPFEHWLKTIATRVGYYYWKQKKQKQQAETFDIQEWDQIQDQDDDRIDPEKAASLIHKLLALLPDRDRLVLTLRYLEGYSTEETARQTGWSQTLVKVQTWRAKNKLKEICKQKNLELEL